MAVLVLLVQVSCVVVLAVYWLCGCTGCVVVLVVSLYWLCGCTGCTGCVVVLVVWLYRLGLL